MNRKSVIEIFLMEREGERFTAQQIVEWFCQTYPEHCKQKIEKSERLNSQEDVAEQLCREVYAQFSPNASSPIKHTEERPRRFYFSPVSDEEAVITEGLALESIKEQQHEKEREVDLYPKLAEYMANEYAVYLKRIDERCSSKERGKGGNYWLHPDLVGMKNLSVDWHPEIRECAGQHKDKYVQLWSFEVKRTLNGENARKSFFQAVSNSSWANFGYLATADIENSNDINTRRELEILCSAYGVGLILINKEQPSDSQTLVPARERKEIDWHLSNRLLTTNSDFKNFIEVVSSFYQTRKFPPKDWLVNPPAEKKSTRKKR